MATSIWIILTINCFVFAPETRGIEFSEAPTGDQPYRYKTKFFKQRIDHFGFVRDGYFKQRYLVNDTFWNPREAGPIFFYTGNEGDIEAFAQNSGFMWDSAPEFGALLIFAEHRYYGKSLPYGKKSLQPDPNFNGYLTSEQALADYAELLTYLKSHLEGAKDSPVIAFGGSYGGMLAAWFRMKYPHICAGAIAASAPVAQFSTPCDAFGRIVTADYSAAGKLCSATIRSSWAAIDNVTSTDAGMKSFNELFKFCKPLKTKDDVGVFKGFLNNLWTNVAMMDYPYPTTFLMPLPGNPVKAVCKAIMKSVTGEKQLSNITTIKAIYKGANVYTNFTGKLKCLSMDDPDQIGADMWDYQACSEMVMPFCFNGKDDMFEKASWNQTAFVVDCEKRWKVTPRPQMANTMYGAKDLYGASNIIFSNGLLDPWSSGGIMRNISESVVALIIPEGAHHLDLRGSNPEDPPSVRKARKIEKKFIRKWIKEARSHHTSDEYGPSDDSIITG